MTQRTPVNRPFAIARRRQRERGFALLLVFLMASAVAMMLYMQLPRQAFESERDKEQLLIDRGEQYKRAIYMYYVQNNRQWPSKIEDLESTNNHRYLRRRYVNPYTGKDEWRLIHTNGAFLTDSLVTPPPAQATPGTGTSGTTSGGALAGTGAPTGTSSFSTLSNLGVDPNAPPPAVNTQVQRRPSDQALVQNSSFQTLPGNVPNANGDPGYQPFNPASLPPISLYPNGYNAPAANVTPNAPGQPGVNQPYNQSVNQPNLNQAGVNQGILNQGGLNQGALNQGGINLGGLNPGAPGAVVPGTNFPGTNPGVTPPNLANFNQPGFNQTGFNQANGVNQQNPSSFGFNPPAANQSGGVPNQPFMVQQVPANVNPSQPISPAGFNPTGQQAAPGGAPGGGQAINLINQLLTTPRQAPAGIGPNQQSGTGGLAGVASTFKGASIKSYADREKYEEWEFVFQLNPQGGVGTLQAPVGPNGSGSVPNGGPAGNGTAGGATGASFGGTIGGATGGAGAQGFGNTSGGSQFGGTSR